MFQSPQAPVIENTLELKGENVQVGKDYHSFTNPEMVKVTHLSLDLTVNFFKSIGRPSET
jgi:hypothetical protein